MKITRVKGDFVLTPETKLDREYFERLNSSVNALKKQNEELQAIFRNVNRAVGWIVTKSEEQEVKAEQTPIWVVECKREHGWTIYGDSFYWTREEAREKARMDKSYVKSAVLKFGITGFRVRRYRGD